MRGNIKDEASKVAKYLEDSDFVRCISHNDADGLAAASVLCESLRRMGKPFHTSIVGSPSRDIVDRINEEEDRSVIFFDMGSGQPDLIKNIESKVAVVDHHPPSYKDEYGTHHLNPHHFGIDGSFSASASTLSYLVCKNFEIDNKDLGAVALAGAIGDMQHLPMDGLNLEILNEMRSSGIINIKKGVRYTKPLNKALRKSTSPYLKGITGNTLKIEKIFKSLNIDEEKTFWELNEEEKTRLASFLILKLIKQGSEINRIKSTIGEVYEVIEKEYNFVSDLTSLLNTCGKNDQYGLALSLVFSKKEGFEEARKLEEQNSSRLIDKIKDGIESINETEYLYHVEIDNRNFKGTVAGVLVDYIFTDKPVLTYYINNEISISSRGNKSLIKEGLNLSKAMSKAAGDVGGNGGGHNIASGATIPRDELDNFINKANEIIGEQMW